jgi:hypothetical protein
VILMARYKASSRKAYSPKRKPRLIPLSRFSYHVDAIPSKVQKILKRYKAEFKHQIECPICGENSLMVLRTIRARLKHALTQNARFTAT